MRTNKINNFTGIDQKFDAIDEKCDAKGHSQRIPMNNLMMKMQYCNHIISGLFEVFTSEQYTSKNLLAAAETETATLAL